MAKTRQSRPNKARRRSSRRKRSDKGLGRPRRRRGTHEDSAANRTTSEGVEIIDFDSEDGGALPPSNRLTEAVRSVERPSSFIDAPPRLFGPLSRPAPPGLDLPDLAKRAAMHGLEPGLAKRIAMRDIEWAAERHNKQRDPYAPWLAYTMSRAVGFDVPEWVLLHFDHVSEELGKSSSARRPWPRERDHESDAFILAALGFKLRGRSGRGSPASRAQRHARDERLARAVAKLVNQRWKTPAAISEVAARAGLSTKTVERALYSGARPQKVAAPKTL